MSDRDYEERRKHIFRGQTKKHIPESSISPKGDDIEKTSSIPVRSLKRTKAKVRLEDTKKNKTDRILF